MARHMSGSAPRCSGNALRWGSLTGGSQTTPMWFDGVMLNRWHDRRECRRTEGRGRGCIAQGGGLARPVREEDDRPYGDRSYEDRGYRYGDDFSEDDEADEPAPPRTRAAERESLRESARERSSTVRSIARPSSTTVSYP